MTKRWIERVLILLLLVTLPACGLGRVLREGLPTPVPPVELAVTADQIAQAMQDDEFFSDYRGNLLLVTGKVHSVNQQGKEVQIELETNLRTKVFCDLGAQTAAVQPGDQVTVEAKTSEAERGPSAVLLKNCRLHSAAVP